MALRLLLFCTAKMKAQVGFLTVGGHAEANPPLVSSEPAKKTPQTTEPKTKVP